MLMVTYKEILSYIIMIQQTYFLWFGLRLEIGTICRDHVPVALDRVADDGLLAD